MAPKRARTQSEPIFLSEDGVIFTGQEQRENYIRLASFNVLHTAYFKDEMLEELGLKGDIKYMASTVGWAKFLRMKEPAYKSLTYEFLSSLVVNGDELTFRLGNQDRKLSLDGFMHIFGFKFGGTIKENDGRHSDDLQRFWEHIAYSPGFSSFDSAYATAASIYNPCFRLMQSFVAQTIFGRPHSQDKVMTGELLFLYCMTYEDVRLNTGAFIVDHMKKLSTLKQYKGPIFVGGMVTSIARHFSISLNRLQRTKIAWIDIDTCVEMRLIFKRNSCCYLRVLTSTKPWPLPDIASTTVQNVDNWKETFHDNTFGDYIDQHEYDTYCKQLYGDTVSSVETSTDDEEDNEQCSDLRSVVERVENVEAHLKRLPKIEKMMKQVYNWHVKQGHLSSPTPPQ